MYSADASMLVDLIDRQKAAWSLDQRFYNDPAIFALEQEHWFPMQWALMGHLGELPSKGVRLVRTLFGEEILIVRAGDEDIRAFYNVCTHRGSRLCKEDGRAPLLTCPYHAWSFALDGSLRSRKELPEGIDPDKLGLRPLPVRVVAGLIFCGLDEARLPDFEPATLMLGDALEQHGIERGRIAARQVYPTQANWKLVVENFFECYHCRPAHPEYFRVNGHVKVTAMSDPTHAAEWNSELEAWLAEPGELLFDQPLTEAGGVDRMPYGVYSKPVGSGRKTLSSDGELVASRLMGKRTRPDGAETAFRFGRLSFISATSDHATLVEIKPRSVDQTDVVLTWLVDEDAEVADVDRLTWMWDVTTRQDKRIVENNAAGVLSRGYRPGPYTALESQTDWFVRTYLHEMRLLAGGSISEVPKAPRPVGY